MNNDYEKMQAMLAKVKAATVESPPAPNHQYPDGSTTAVPSIPKIFKMTPGDAFKKALIDVMIPAILSGISSTGHAAWDNFINTTSSKVNGGWGGTYRDYSTKSTPWSNNYSSYSNSSKPGKYKGFLSVSDITFEYREEALGILDDMNQIIRDTGRVSCADYFNLRRMTPPSYTSQAWGWTELGPNRAITQSGGKYILDLPTITPIK